MGKHKKNIFIFLFLTVIIGSSFFFNLNDGFLSDDFDMVYQTEKSEINPLSYLFSNRFGLRGQGDIYRPFFVLSFYLDHFFYQNEAWGYHLTNLLLYLLSSFFVFLLIKNILIKRHSHKISFFLAFLTSSFFALSPLHSESVVWISGRTDLIAFFFFILSWYFLVKSEEKKKFLFSIFSLLSFFLSLLSKEMTVVFPFLLLLYFFLYSSQGIVRKVLWYFLILIIYFFLRYFSLGVLLGGYGSLSYFSNFSYSLQVFIFNFLYFFFFWTENLRPNLSLFFLNYFIFFFSFLVFLLILIGIFLKKHLKEYFLSLAILFFFLLPVINLPINLYGHDGQRVLYFSSLGFSFLLSLLLYAFFEKRNHLLYFLSIFLLLFHLFFTVKFNLLWQKAFLIEEKLISDFSRIIDLKKKQKIVILNFPDNLEGAYISRNGFREALKLKDSLFSLEMTIFPFGLQLREENKDQDLISWKQTRNNFFVGEKINSQFNLIMGPENFKSREISSKILNYNKYSHTGEKIWIELSPIFLKENKNVSYIYFNQGTWQSLLKR